MAVKNIILKYKIFFDVYYLVSKDEYLPIATESIVYSSGYAPSMKKFSERITKEKV